MTTMIRIVGFLLLSCFAILSQDSSKPMSSSTSEPEKCADPDSKSAFALQVLLPHTTIRSNTYDVDYSSSEGPYHKAICLSESKADTLFWYVSKSKNFKMKISYKSGGAACQSHPFVATPPVGDLPYYYSGPPRPGTAGCEYSVVFPKGEGQTADPHIRIAP